MGSPARIWWLAATLSMCVPGLGQVYNGQVLRGVVLCLLMVLGSLVPLLLILMRGALFLWIALPLILLLLIHIWIITDAMVVARRLGSYRLRWCNRPLVYIVFSVATVMVFLFGKWVVIRHCFDTWVMNSFCHEGMLMPGDTVLCNRLAFGLVPAAAGREPSWWWRDPAIDEVVLCRSRSEPSRVLPARCIATAGQTVTVTGSQLSVDDGYRIFFDDRFEAWQQEPEVVQVPDGHVAVLTVGAGSVGGSGLLVVDRAQLLGQPLLVIWSVDPQTRRARFDRIGLPVL